MLEVCRSIEEVLSDAGENKWDFSIDVTAGYA